MVTGAFDERPIYFASSGSAAHELGLDGYLVRQGLAFRLTDLPLAEAPPEGVEILPTSPLTQVTGRYLDVARTATLLDEVFVHQGGIPDWSHWPDHSTIGIPNYYAWTYWALAQAYYQRDDEETSDRYRERAEAWTRLGS